MSDERPRRCRSLGLVPALAVVLAVVVTASDGLAGSDAIGWDPGYGVTVQGGSLPGEFWIAGDVTVEGEVLEEEESVLELDDFSLLARWEPSTRLALFGELRLEDLWALTEGMGSETGSGDLTIERLFAEILLTPTLTLRAGKIFTPYGIWNVVNRAPLTWTPDRPAATENFFPQHATGLALLYQTTLQGWSLDATAYGPAQDELAFRRADEDDLAEDGLLFGGRLAAGRAVGPAFAALGVNGATFEEWGNSEWLTATGLDLEVAVAGHQITGELNWKIRPSDRRTVQGFYLQDVIPLTPLLPMMPELYGVLRFEQFQPARGRSAIAGVAGLFWRPVPPVVIRANYLFTSENVDALPRGFGASLSILF